MINLYRNFKRTAQNKQIGAATLVTTVFLFILSSLIILYAANHGKLFTQTTANTARADRAFEAAEAGLEFAINYLKENKDTVISSASGGAINYTDSNLTGINLGNGSSFSVNYTNPTVSNYELILVTSTGTNTDGSSTRTVQQLVQHGSILINPPNTPLISKGDINMSGNAAVINNEGSATINSAGTVTLSGSADTTNNGGVSSTAGNNQADITENNAALSSTPMTDFFTLFFETNPTDLKGSFEHQYSNSSSTNYKDVLDGMTGTSIWIEQTGSTTASINGNTTIGTTDNPVLMVVNGNFSLSGNVTINGFVFVLGTNTIATFTGNTEIIGSLVTTDTLNMTGSIELAFDSTTLANLQNNSAIEYYAKVPGSWRDF